MKRIQILSIIFVIINLGSHAYAQTCVVFGDISMDPISNNDCCYFKGEDVYFSADIAPNSGQCQIALWSWNFGDGTSVVSVYSSNLANHSFALPGVYLVSAVPYDNIGNPLTNGGYTTFSITVIVKLLPECSKCAIADFTFLNYNCGYSTTHFTNLSVVPSCTTGVVYNWDFGDPATGVDNTSTLWAPSHVFSAAGTYNVTLTVTIALPNGQVCSDDIQYSVDVTPGLPYPNFIPYPQINIVNNPTYVNTPVTFHFVGDFSYYVLSYINYGDNTSSVGWNINTTQSISHTYTQTGSYHVTVQLNPNPNYLPSGYGECRVDLDYWIEVLPIETELPCIDCIGSFNPEHGQRYIVSAWVREDGADPLRVDFTNPSLKLTFHNSSGTQTVLPNMKPSGEIIDGWQRIEEQFLVPVDAAKLTIKLNCSSGNCLFDDVRVFPYDGTMKSYVYDPVTLKLAAELDERNYATLYEYDEEGKLIRVKKETERGIMTIKESRNHTSNK